MQAEYDDVRGFKEWDWEQQAAMAADEVMRLMNEKRRMTIHTDAIHPRARIGIAISAQAIVYVETELRVIRADGGEEVMVPESPAEPFRSKQHDSPGARTQWTWFFEETEDRDVVTLCEEYPGQLGKLVAECEERFGRK